MGITSSPIVKSIHVRNFRSLENAVVSDCSGFNAFIGQNNAGKSGILRAIQTGLDHLADGSVVKPWAASRHADEFTDKEVGRSIQIGLEMGISEEVRNELISDLTVFAPQLSRSVESLKEESSVSFIFRFVQQERQRYQYVESISFGGIACNDNGLVLQGERLIYVPSIASFELHEVQTRLAVRQKKVRDWTVLRDSDAQRYFRDKTSNGMPGRFYLERSVADASPAFIREAVALVESTENVESFKRDVGLKISTLAQEIEELSDADLTNSINAYSGDVKKIPEYVAKLMSRCGAVEVLNLKESKQPIGKSEAEQLLKLKVRRGGPEQLRVVQQTVKALLGVDIDAFQSEDPANAAEMDINDFLVEANGAGVREALRLILDVELKKPKLLLLEEPEVHLHPGLEHAVHRYLQEKSEDIQIFFTTHSTNFIDTVSSQNIYLVKRNHQNRTVCERVGDGEAPIKIAPELGLRLSTVFMFERLVFVEGPSDEAVLRQIAQTLNLDLARTGVAFVHMGGIANFTHYAAEATLDLLSQRRVRMWFVVDRDERDDDEVKAMLARLGDRAKLHVLGRREIENYLFDENAISSLAAAKIAGSGRTSANTVDSAAIKDFVQSSLKSWMDEAIRLRVEKRMLAPIYLRGRRMQGDIDQRLASAIASLQTRSEQLKAVSDDISRDITQKWDAQRALEMLPGTLMLEQCFAHFGLQFDKAGGDSAALAVRLQSSGIKDDLKNLLREIAG